MNKAEYKKLQKLLNKLGNALNVPAGRYCIIPGYLHNGCHIGIYNEKGDLIKAVTAIDIPEAVRQFKPTVMIAEEFILNKKMSLHPKIIMYTHKEVCDFLDEYVQQVSREKIKSFLEFTCDMNYETLAHTIYNFNKYFNEWKSNQEEQ